VPTEVPWHGVIAVGNTGPHIVERAVRKGEKGYNKQQQFSSMMKPKCGLILAKATAFRINLSLDGATITRNSLVLVCSLSSHRHSYIDFIFTSRFIDS
jgi:hypothetical protein